MKMGIRVEKGISNTQIYMDIRNLTVHKTRNTTNINIVQIKSSYELCIISLFIVYVSYLQLVYKSVNMAIDMK